jgi:hypothetical protein
MIWALYVGGAIFVLIVLFVLWGFLHLRHSMRKAVSELQKVELVDIEPLASECIKTFKEKLGITLDFHDCDDAASKLDGAFQDNYKLKQAFARQDFYWYVVKPVGAFLGELLRRYADHQWRKEPGETPSMVCIFNEGESQLFPFDKVIKQLTTGGQGDIMAYVMSARTIKQFAENMAKE